MKKLCFWSIGLKTYAPILQAAVQSYRDAKLPWDFFCIADHNIDGATETIPHPTEFNFDGWHFKLRMLRQFISHKEYEHFVYVDSDTWFVRHPDGIEQWAEAGGNGACMLEGDCAKLEVANGMWGQIRLRKWVSLCRRMGVPHREIRNTNGGIWSVRRSKVDAFLRDCAEFRAKAQMEKWPECADEPCVAYAVMRSTGNLQPLLVQNNTKLWSCVLDRSTGNEIPANRDLHWHMFITNDHVTTNAAILHAMTYKCEMAKMGWKMWGEPEDANALSQYRIA